MEEEQNKKVTEEDIDIPLLISDLCNENSEEINYYLQILEEILKYPFWKVDGVEKVGDFLSFQLNEGTTLIKIRFISNQGLHSHLTYLLHQSITEYIKKRKVIKVRTKPDILAKKKVLVIEIKPSQKN